ncbi:MAG: YdeI/OmpD-associated family protein [Anaerolineae bacterium]|nr:YdeI/OmpD-associated family protein [Anaerolineae bacterium]MCB0250846.1 YdeI/OmpD-associated family protein [Anaerolineae bacterium]MCB9132074.1 YdeI/OmpD-associated family protein [Anaerolineales bacterium]MCB9143147.1 YdeI/OmpD-associated family protein [Anaerolineales bacterium]MCO5246213.1 YdeI/OmpD-associated family protein [Anaerolineae bacterium]
MAAKKEALATLPFASQEDWRAWLAANHATSAGVWLQLAKVDTGVPSVTYAEALEVALCYGWIDGQKRGLDDVWWLQKFTPRGPRSIWSKINRAKAEQLIASGAMQPAGLAAVEQAMSNGQWEAAYDSQAAAGVPDDLQAALEQNPDALAFFATLNSRNRFAILHRVQTAKKPETRARRIAQFVEMLENGEKIYP